MLWGFWLGLHTIHFRIISEEEGSKNHFDPKQNRAMNRLFFPGFQKLHIWCHSI